MRTTRFLKSLMLPLAFAGTLGIASASQIIQTFTLPNTTLDISGVGTFTFNYFLSSGAAVGSTLTSVQLQIAVHETLNVLSTTNTAGNGQTFRYHSESEVDTTGSAPGADLTTLNNNLDASGGGGVLGTFILFNTGNVFYNSGQTINWVPPLVNKNADSGLINAASITPYNTSGTFTMGFDTFTSQAFVGGGGNAIASQVTVGGGTVSVIYNFTDPPPPPTGTPEPASMALMGSALIGISMWGRKRLARR
jgi:hypothetical protein